MISDRIYRILQAELNDFLGKNGSSKQDNHSKSIFDDWYDFFAGEENEEANKGQQKQESRQNNRSQNQSSQNKDWYYRKKGQEQKSNHNQESRYEKKYYYSNSYSKSYYNSPSQEELRYYQALEIKSGASFEEIKASYKSLMKKYHPDRFNGNPSQQQNAIKVCQKINEAYDYFKKKYGK